MERSTLRYLRSTGSTAEALPNSSERYITSLSVYDCLQIWKRIAILKLLRVELILRKRIMCVVICEDQDGLVIEII